MADEIGRNIFCHKCGQYVGTIRDAKLQVGLKYICDRCSQKTEVPDIFKTIFGGKV